MPRKPLITSPIFPYHVCARANNREWFTLPLDEVWDIFTKCLIRTQELFGCDYYAFVLMGNHFHLIIGTPNENVGLAMRHFLTEASRGIARASNRINKIFGARYKWSILQDAYSYAYVLKYVLRNPIRARICERAELYPYSTLSQTWVGRSDLPICSRADGLERFVPRIPSEMLSWLNEPIEPKHEQLIENALRRFEFKFSRSNDQQKILRELRKNYGVEPLG